MSDITTYFIGDTTATDAAITDETELSPRMKAVVIVGLALAAWVPVLLPIYLIFGR